MFPAVNRWYVSVFLLLTINWANLPLKHESQIWHRPEIQSRIDERKNQSFNLKETMNTENSTSPYVNDDGHVQSEGYVNHEWFYYKGIARRFVLKKRGKYRLNSKGEIPHFLILFRVCACNWFLFRFRTSLQKKIGIRPIERIVIKTRICNTAMKQPALEHNFNGIIHYPSTLQHLRNVNGKGKVNV